MEDPGTVFKNGDRHCFHLPPEYDRHIRCGVAAEQAIADIAEAKTHLPREQRWTPPDDVFSAIENDLRPVPLQLCDAEAAIDLPLIVEVD